MYLELGTNIRTQKALTKEFLVRKYQQVDNLLISFTGFYKRKLAPIWVVRVLDE